MSSNWFAVTVRPNHERTTQRALSARGLESYLPLYRSRKSWSDRVKEADAPLFPGYVFCRFSYLERMQVLGAPGVRTILESAPVDESEISSVRALVSSGRPILPWPYLRVGERVIVSEGPLESLRGIIVRIKNSWRVVVSIEALSCSVAVELDAEACNKI